MSEILTVDAILFGLLVFSGIIGNILVINVVRENDPTLITKIYVFISVHLSVLADTFIQCDLQCNQRTRLHFHRFSLSLGLELVTLALRAT